MKTLKRLFSKKSDTLLEADLVYTALLEYAREHFTETTVPEVKAIVEKWRVIYFRLSGLSK